MHPIYRRIYSKNSREKLSTRLRRALRWWLRVLASEQYKRCIEYEEKENNPIILYTDAEGGTPWLGATFYDPVTGEHEQFSTPSLLRGVAQKVIEYGQLCEDEDAGLETDSREILNYIQLYETE
jgi:hypothetical protein